MNSGPTAERVYDALKQRIVAGEFSPGSHLDPASLTSTLGSSVTPVREALYRLAGEQLVDMRTSSGFHLRYFDEPGLQDLYDWNAMTLLNAIRAWRASADATEPLPATSDGPSAARLFTAIGQRAANAEAARAIAALNDRLNAVRRVEQHVLDHIDPELAALGAALAEDRRHDLRQAVTRYHRRRRRMAATIVRALYRRS